MSKKTNNKKDSVNKVSMFKNFIKNLTLLSIELIEMKLVKSENFMLPAKIKFSQEHKVKKVKNKEGNIAAYSKFTLKATAKDNEKNTLTIVANYKILYSNDIEISDDILNEFKAYNASVVIWPYFRYFVQEMTMKANLPPLTMDLLSMSIPKIKKNKSE